MTRRLYLISHRDMRKNRADCVHIMRICREFSNNDFLVTLVTPRTIRFEYKKKLSDIWDIHKILPTFKVIELPVFIFDNMPKITNAYSRLMRFINFGFYYLLKIITGKLTSNDAVYLADHGSGIPLILLRKLKLARCRIFLDKSEVIKSGVRNFVARNVDGLVAINSYIREKSIELYNIKPERIFRRSFPSMNDEMESYNVNNRDYYREELKVPLTDKIAVYSGKVSPDLNEIMMILQAAKFLVNDGIKVYFIGVREKDKKFFSDYTSENKLTNVTFVGFQPVDTFIKYIKTADVLISYYDRNDFDSSYVKVPAKSSLYLSANIPSIFADVPSLREWFSDDMVYFVEPNSPAKLAEKIKYVLSHSDEASKKAAASADFAKQNDYGKSFREVSEFINSYYPS